jgi:formate/nitrite transporter FocA (FNT family)
VASAEPDGLKPGAQSRPEVGTRLSAEEIHDNILVPARKELERPAAALFWSALASGLAIALSFLGGAYASTLVAEPHAKAAAAAAYPLGFIVVILGRLALFTENTLVPVIPLLNHRDARTLWQVLRMWGILLAGNLVGAAAFAIALAYTPMVSPELGEPLRRLADEATAGGFWRVAYQALFAGWLISLLTWLLAATHSTGAHIVLTWLATAPIAALGFRHSIAGSVDAFYLAAVGEASLGRMAGEFVIPAVLGNAVGGVLLVALLNYGQVAAEREPTEAV